MDTVALQEVNVSYNDIYVALRHNIEDGTYPYQGYLPSEPQLINHFHSTRNNVRRALALLAQYGYVQPVHGKGVRVIWQAHTTRTILLESYIESCAELVHRTGLAIKTQIISFESLSCDQKLALDTNFSVGDKLVHIERLRISDDKAIVFDNNYFLASAIRGITPEQASQSIYAYIENTLGQTITTTNRLLTVERANERDCALLDLGSVDFLAVVTSDTFNGHGEMIEHTQSRHHPDYFSFFNTATRIR